MNISYLTENQAIQKLKCNKSIEQWLGAYIKDGIEVIKFITLHNERKSKPNIWFCEVEDIGSEEYLDVYAFSSLDEDNPEDINYEFESVESMIAFCEEQYKISRSKFVGQGMLQDVYLKHLKSK